MVVNITDGASTDGNPEEPAQKLRAIASSDGEVLLFNVHLSSLPGEPVEFPDQDEKLPDNFARQLFRMSSVLPPKLRELANGQGKSFTEKSRGFAFNADLITLIKFLQIGTPVKNDLMR